MSVPAVRRIVVGVDGSAESAAAFRWACREASLRRLEVHAVHVREAKCHGVASYAVPPLSDPGDEVDIEEVLRPLISSQASEASEESGVQVRTEVIEGLAARVLLDQCAGADMLVLGSAGDVPGPARSAGPVIRACLRRAPCPVVVISVAQESSGGREAGGCGQESRGGKVPFGAAVPVGV